MPVETTRCHCSGCHQTFSGRSTFDKHHTFPDGGTLTCHDPAGRGLVLRDLHGVMVWGWPSSEDSAWVSTRRS
jgi:hypothetical protein